MGILVELYWSYFLYICYRYQHWTTQMIPDDSNWFQMIPNDCKWIQMIPNDSRWFQTIPDDSRWFQMMCDCVLLLSCHLVAILGHGVNKLNWKVKNTTSLHITTKSKIVLAPLCGFGGPGRLNWESSCPGLLMVFTQSTICPVPWSFSV